MVVAWSFIHINKISLSMQGVQYLLRVLAENTPLIRGLARTACYI